MGRVLVVSRNPGMAMGLASTEHDVVDIRPSAFEEWVDDSRGQRFDGVVLDVTDAEAAVRAITELRANAQMAPVLVVPGDGPGWEDARMRELPAAAVLPRPVTNPSLQDAVDRLVANGTQSLLMSSVASQPGESDERGGDSSPAPARADSGSSTDQAADPAVDDAVAVAAADADPATPAEDHGMSTLFDRLTTTPSVVHPLIEPMAAAALALDPPVAPDVRGTFSTRDPLPSPEDLMGATPRKPRAMELVQALLAATDDLYGVNETAQAIVSDALERTGGGAAAVMLPDGERWRVVAGTGLRALEHRFELTSHDWLVVEVAEGNRSVVMEDTDIVRQPLRGSPLASWHHLVATPIPLVTGVLLVARAEDPAFTQGDVESLAALTAEAAPLVASSLQVRMLARRLDHLRDQSDPVVPHL